MAGSIKPTRGTRRRGAELLALAAALLSAPVAWALGELSQKPGLACVSETGTGARQDGTALAASPGSSSAAIAKAAGISPSVAAATISRLVRQGRVRRLDQGGYSVVEPPTDDRPAAAAETGSGTGAGTQPSPAEAPREPPPAAPE